MDARLDDRFTGVFGKRLAPTEIRTWSVSKSQAIQVGAATALLGTPNGKEYFEADLFRLTDDATPMMETERLTLTDVRARQPSRNAEWRLNYPVTSSVMKASTPGDLCWIARRRDDPSRLLFVVAPPDSEVAARLDRLMGTGLDTLQPVLPDEMLKPVDFTAGSTSSLGAKQIDGSDAWLLEILGVPVATPNDDLLARLTALVAGKAVSPKTGFVAVEPFCAAVRSLLPEVDGRDPDAAIDTWMEVTEELYFLYEETVIQKRLDDTFANRPTIHIGTFTSVASSILNTRKSRAGGALESHLAAVFKANGIAYQRVLRPLKSDKTKPDFLMPSIELYEDDAFQEELLSTVAAKRTLKERWMQVKAEGARVRVKHLATVDRDVPVETIHALPIHDIIPVMPKPLRDGRYSASSDLIWTFEDLVSMLLDKQSGAIELGYAIKIP